MDNTENIKILKRINNNPRYTQRELALELGYSLGKLNYCFKELKKKGLLKVKNSRYIINPKNKLLEELTTQQDEVSKGDVEINAYSERLVQIGMGNYFIEVYFEDHKADSFNFDQLKDLLGYTNDKSLVSKLEKLDGYQINKNNTVSGEIMCDFIRKFKYSSNGKWMNRSSSDRYQKVKS